MDTSDRAVVGEPAFTAGYKDPFMSFRAPRAGHQPQDLPAHPGADIVGTAAQSGHHHPIIRLRP
ncbi:hypothetical protein, partial [Frankia sp. Cr1]|uniref:hypothetical protein n=1 Tax=Frankia sp. Cr1 TaxID=3073931 RepID=UPI002AD431B2